MYTHNTSRTNDPVHIFIDFHMHPTLNYRILDIGSNLYLGKNKL